MRNKKNTLRIFFVLYIIGYDKTFWKVFYHIPEFENPLRPYDAPYESFFHQGYTRVGGTYAPLI